MRRHIVGPESRQHADQRVEQLLVDRPVAWPVTPIRAPWRKLTDQRFQPERRPSAGDHVGHTHSKVEPVGAGEVGG